jgi:hypothetical protein
MVVPKLNTSDNGYLNDFNPFVSLDSSCPAQTIYIDWARQHWNSPN